MSVFWAGTVLLMRSPGSVDPNPGTLQCVGGGPYAADVETS